MESFYRKRLVAHGITLLPPVMEEVEEVDRIIYEELMQGKVTRAAERTLKSMLTTMANQGAQAAVLGCTELDMIVDVDANVLPIYDCTRIHAEAAVDWIFG
jgi:aspartate racemase